MLNRLSSYPILAIFSVVLIMLAFTIDTLPVSIMEARNFITAREMLADDNWLLTTMNGEPRYQKPPLPTWITAVFGSIFGIKSLFAIRLPSILMIAVTGVYTYLLSYKLVEDKVHSLRNALIVVTSFYVIFITIEAPWDIYTHGFMLIALYHLFNLLKLGAVSFKHAVPFILFLGCSVLSKGPVSLYVLFLSFLIAYGIVYRYKKNFKFYSIIFVFIIVGLAVGGWWYFYVRVADPETFTAIASKETSNWSSYNVRPFYYYWSFFTQSGLWTIPAFISLLYPYMKSRVSHLKAYKFSFFWTIIAFILLSIIPEKKSRYLMPVLIPLAINIGFYIDFIIRSFKTMSKKYDAWPVYFNFGLIGLIAIAFPSSVFILKIDLSGTQLIRYIIASILLFTIGILIFRSLYQKRIAYTFYLLIAFMVTIGCFALPLNTTQIQDGYRSIVEIKENAEIQNMNLYHLDYVAPEVIWNYGDIIKRIKSEGKLELPSDAAFLLLTNKESPQDYDSLKDYTIEALGSYDLNIAEPDTRSHRARLVNTLYLVKK